MSGRPTREQLHAARAEAGEVTAERDLAYALLKQQQEAVVLLLPASEGPSSFSNLIFARQPLAILDIIVFLRPAG
jgi:hypothetical protein